MAAQIVRGRGDVLVLAFERERRHWQLVPWPMEMDAVMAHVFCCVCCGRMRSEEERREPRSLVCMRCERAAGFGL